MGGRKIEGVSITAIVTSSFWGEGGEGEGEGEGVEGGAPITAIGVSSESCCLATASMACLLFIICWRCSSLFLRAASCFSESSDSSLSWGFLATVGPCFARFMRALFLLSSSSFILSCRILSVSS